MGIDEKELTERFMGLFQRAGGSLSLGYEQDRKAIADFAKELAAPAVYVQFRHIPDRRESDWLGPFRFAQVTYDTVQVEEMDGTLDEELATYDNDSGAWYTSFGGPRPLHQHMYEAWTDIVISSTRPDKEAT